jgi:hypothetical protein
MQSLLPRSPLIHAHQKLATNKYINKKQMYQAEILTLATINFPPYQKVSEYPE